MSLRRVLNKCCGSGLCALPVAEAPATSVSQTQLRFAAQTLKDIEKHGAKTTSRLLKDNYPDIAREVDTSAKNTMIPSSSIGTPPTSGDVDVNTLPFDSGRRVPWKCNVCSFQWVSSVLSRTIIKNGCPSCHRRNNPLLRVVDHKIFMEYSTRRNRLLMDPEMIEITDKTRLWWTCGSCGFEFIAKACDRASGKAPCPECDRGQYADFKIKKILLEEFHPTKNGDLTLAKLRPTDKLPVWWLCHQCGHEYSCLLSHRVAAGGKKTTLRNVGTCPKCYAREKIENLSQKEERMSAKKLKAEEAAKSGKQRRTKKQMRGSE